MTPDVSVIIPAWNAEATLAETVASVSAQTHRAIEILIVDDGSTDGTAALAHRLAAGDGRISVIAKANGGVATARNAGLARARGTWAAWLDADDLWHPDKIARQLEAARSAEALDQGRPAFVYTGHRLIDEEGRILPNPRTLADISGETLCRQIATTYFTNVSSIMAPVDLARACGGHDPILRQSGVEGAEDLLLQLRLAMRGPAAFVPQALVGYRMHGANMSRSVARAARSNLMALDLVAREAPEVPAWVFGLARARTFGFALQIAAAGSPAAALGHLRAILPGQPLQVVRQALRSLAWVAGAALGARPRDPALGQSFLAADPATVPVEGHMLLATRDRHWLKAADLARASAHHRFSGGVQARPCP
ncbi:glycosyltransferase family 2 protein [Sandaracinobacteroides sp. A072]|uniref:glycosyltransferase family 2 protein n=1 Tax=Sandaracinobacteroides sp. A072 TaxID=3461146 RepID=UPI00404249FA